MGYFKASGRFFSVERFVAADRAYVQQRYELGEVAWERYERVASFRHRPLVLHHFGVAPFDEVQLQVQQQALHLARQQMNPVAVFRSLVDFLLGHRWEIPTYATLAGLVTEAFRAVEQRLGDHLARLLTPDQQLYAFAGMDLPDLAGFSLRLGCPLDRELIEAQWETILRLVVSLKQKVVTASIVLKRLSAYAQHHPLYLAPRELGRAGRTEFLLRYLDGQDLRKRIDDQLDKLENTHLCYRAR